MANRPPRPRRDNPIQVAISNWLSSLPATVANNIQPWQDDLIKSAPKRFTIYEPMLLLPTSSFTSVPWTTTIDRCGEDARASLWTLILKELSKQAKGDLTHLAVNEGIPLNRESDDAENVLRSPSGLRMLCGASGHEPADGNQPSSEDFDKTLWVCTKQNGIRQTWAPQWTMFSRGNVKEKARVLGFDAGAVSRSSRSADTAVWAVDLYAGIGYFVFSYASLGMRVLCWEINPWSVEGLRRGAEANQWSIKVVQGSDLGRPMSEVMAGQEQIVVFLEDNQKAVGRISDLHSLGLARNVTHVNCGFLPTSQPTWKQAWELTGLSEKTWLHLHENVGVKDIESRRASIQGIFENWSSTGSEARTPNVEHVEQVKTFAPGVWHCVFDVQITTSTNTT